MNLKKKLYEWKEEIGVGVFLLWFFAATSLGQAIWGFIVPSQAELERETFKQAFYEMAERNKNLEESYQRLTKLKDEETIGFYQDQIRFVKETRGEDPEKLKKMQIIVPKTMAKRLKKRLGEEE